MLPRIGICKSIAVMLMFITGLRCMVTAHSGVNAVFGPVDQVLESHERHHTCMFIDTDL